MGKINMSAVQAKQEELQRGSNNGDYGFDSLKSGKNLRRVLPPKEDSDMFYSEGYLHFGLGSDGKTAVTCLDTFGKKCPVCEYLESIKNSKAKEDKALYKAARKTRRMYINVLNRDSDSEEEIPMVLPIGKMILKQIIDIICDPDYGDITDFETGRDITITKSGKGLDTEYSVLAKPKDSIASEQYSEEELDELLPDLDSLFVEKSEDELNAILAGEDYEEEDDEDEELDYDEMELEDLKYLCKQRGIKVPAKCTKFKLIALLNRYDEEQDEDEEDEDEDYEDDDEDSDEDESEDEEQDEDEEDDLMNDVKKAVKAKRSGKR